MFNPYLIFGFLIIFLSLLPLGVFLVSSKKEKFDVFHPLYIFTALYLVSFPIKYMANMGGSLYHMPFVSPDPWDDLTPLFISLLAYYFLVFPFFIQFPYFYFFPVTSSKLEKIFISRVKLVTIILILLFAFLMFENFKILMFLLSGGSKFYYQIYFSKRLALEVGSGVKSLFLEKSIDILSFVVIYYILVFRPHKIKSIFLLCVIFIWFGLYGYLIKGSKLIFMYPFFIFFILRHYTVKRISLKKAVIYGIIGLNLLALINITRGGFFDLDLIKQTYLRNLIIPFQGFDEFAEGVKRYPISQNLFGVLGPGVFKDYILSHIPRQLWKNKPYLLGHYKYQMAIYPEIIREDNPALTSSITPSFLGEAYLTFGVFGFFIFPIVFGILIRIFYLNMQKNFNLWTSWCYSYILVQSVQIYRAGSGVFWVFFIDYNFMWLLLYILLKVFGSYEK